MLVSLIALLSGCSTWNKWRQETTPPVPKIRCFPEQFLKEHNVPEAFLGMTNRDLLQLYSESMRANTKYATDINLLLEWRERNCGEQNGH